MKFRGLLISLMVTLGLSAGADEKTAAWERLYSASINDEMRLGVMINIVELKDKAFTPMLMDSLSTLLASNPEKGTPTEVKVKTDLARIIIRELGNLRALEAMDLVYQAYYSLKDLWTRADAIVALGRMRATEKAPFLIKHLDQINTLEPRNKENEILAFALVNSLDLMKSSEAFEVLFYASIGWYSEVSQIRTLAKKSITALVQDPSDPLVKVIKSKNDFQMKLLALEAIENVNTSKENRSKVALAGLEEGVRWNPTDPKERDQLKEIRVKAMKILVANGDKSPSAVPNLAEALRRSADPKDIDEAKLVYRTLGINGTDAATKVLSGELARFNDLKMKGASIRKDDDNRVREVVACLRLTKNKNAVMDLKVATSIPQYTPAFQTEIKNIIKEIEGANP